MQTDRQGDDSSISGGMGASAPRFVTLNPGREFHELHQRLADVLNLPHLRTMLAPEHHDAILAAATRGLHAIVGNWVEAAYIRGLERGEQVARNTQFNGGLMHADEASVATVSPADARREMHDALDGLTLSDQEQRAVRLLEFGSHSTLHALAGIIHIARSSNAEQASRE